jgi:hypothetical protein
MTYRDRYGLYHHKPSINGGSSSNNGWIYTAYAKRLGLDVPPTEVLAGLKDSCMIGTQDGFWINRLPLMQDPVISHDELIGMISLGVLDSYELSQRNWSMTTVGSEEYSLIEQLKGVLSLRGQHRTYVHRNPVEAAYPIVFRILPHIRYYAKKMSEEKPSILEWLAFNASIFLDLVQPSAWASTHNLATLMLEDLDSWFWIRFYDKKKNYDDYFEEGHIFREELEDE